MSAFPFLNPWQPLEADYFPRWVMRAGGYFPKFGQILSCRSDLIHDTRVLEQLRLCLEDMPAQSIETVRAHLVAEGWGSECAGGIGEALNAGTV